MYSLSGESLGVGTVMWSLPFSTSYSGKTPVREARRPMAMASSGAMRQPVGQQAYTCR